MRRNKTILLAISIFSTLFIAEIYAGSIDYLSNQSAEYIRTFSRNASTDADAVYYNPAGTAFMKDGIYFYLSNQVILKKYSNTYQGTLPFTSPYYGTSYQSKEPSLLVPNFYFLFKKDNYSFYLGSGIIAGGGKLLYNQGVPLMIANMPSVYTSAKVLIPPLTGVTFEGGSLSASSYYPALNLGGSYALNDKVSLSLGGRFIYSTKTYQGSATYGLYVGASRVSGTTASLDATETAYGIGAILGVAVKPFDNTLLSARFETPVSLKMKTSVKNGDNTKYGFNSLFKDGYTREKDLPALLAFGASYSFSKQLTVTASLDLFFIGYAGGTYDDTASTDIYAKNGYNQEFSKVGWEASLSAEYAMIPNKLSISAGYMFNKVGGNNKCYNDFDYSLDSHSFGFGTRIALIENFDLTLAAARIFYITSDGFYNKTTDSYLAQYKKNVWNFAVGMQYKL